jgi:uncharacterized protein (TIGR02646 family)
VRQVVRPAVRLPTLLKIETDHGENWKISGLGGPPDDLWNNPDVRGALYAMHGRACIYCEQHLPENDRGDVEHFRPKSLYRWLAYAFDNYLLSCSICNRQLKKDKFPLAIGASRCSYMNRENLTEEPRLLLDPASDSTEAWIDYDVFDDLCPPRPHTGLDARVAQQVEETIDFFRLKERPRLVGNRGDVVDCVRELIDELNAGNQGSADALKKLASRYSRHGSIARKLLFLIRPDLLPTPDEELAMLVEDLCDELQLAMDTRPASRDRRRLKAWERIQSELLWALALLWHTAGAARVEASLDGSGVEGLKAMVAPFRQALVQPGTGLVTETGAAYTET